MMQDSGLSPIAWVYRIGGWSLGGLGALIVGNLVGLSVGVLVHHFLPAYVPHLMAHSPHSRLVLVAAMLPVQIVLAWILFKKGFPNVAWGCVVASILFAAGQVMIALMRFQTLGQPLPNP